MDILSPSLESSQVEVKRLRSVPTLIRSVINLTQTLALYVSPGALVSSADLHRP